MRPAEAGAKGLGGWLDRDGRFYDAPVYGHLRVARELRLTGGGPADPWIMTDGWILIKCSGQVMMLPSRCTQAQLDALSDMATHASEGCYRDWLLDALRKVRQEAGE